ncbi:MAG TPA: AEC family transporter [Gammaproteobacteria bacterium]|nr:AEC family transporter [Gammaproteobacteria bacterium]
MTRLLVALSLVFGLIVLGYVLRRIRVPGDRFWPLAENATYYIFLPALLLVSLATADVEMGDAVPVFSVLVTATLAVTVLSHLLRPLLDVDGPGFGSVFQGAVRSNTYLGIAAAFAAYGEGGLPLAAIAIAALIPLGNVLSVIVVTRCAPDRASNASATAAIVRNPIILACAAGLVLNGLELNLPAPLRTGLDALGRIALPLGLLVVGAGLRVRAALTAGALTLASSALKLVAMPAITLALCLVFSLAGPQAVVAVLFAALPSAGSSYVLASRMGGNATLMASILTVQTLLSFLVLPLLLLLMV